MRHPGKRKLLALLGLPLLSLAWQRPAEATNHILFASEGAANVDGNAQAGFFEVTTSNGQTLWGPGHFNGSGFTQLERASAMLVFRNAMGVQLGTFEFPHDPSEPACCNNFSVLIGTTAYAALTAANRPDPDFTVANGLMVPGGQVCFQNTRPDNVAFFVETCQPLPSNPAGMTPLASGLPRKTTCPSPFIQCNNVCVNTQINESNCGACGNVCASGVQCNNGVCGGNPCPVGQTLCGTTCVNLQTSNTNCGGCGIACTGGTFCSSGACVCPTGQTRCGSLCVNTQTNSNNCGACGNVCPMGTTCSSGTCVCPTGQTLCGNTCVNLQTSGSNCGACGNVCAPGSMCSSGMCQLVCGPGQTNCGGSCVNTQSDDSNCGACGNTCGVGNTCSNGFCVLVCPAGQTNCGGVCVNTQTDNSNCGMCGSACGPGTSCSNGSCASICAPGQTFCGGACVNTQSDNNNCGACGNVCGVGNACSNGFCVSVCGPGQTFCGGSCVNTQNDNNNCGACGNVCGNNTQCSSGTCQAIVGDIERGRRLFTQETFGGNGRTCASCHLVDPGFTGGLPPANVQARFATLATTFDPLFIAEANMNLNTLTIEGDATFPDGAILTSVSSTMVTSTAKVLARKNVFESTVLLVYGGLSPRVEIGATITDGSSTARIVAFEKGSLDAGIMEDPIKMRTSTSLAFPLGRALILENIEGFNADMSPKPPVFRKSPHIQNLGHTGPFGFSDDVADLGDFAQGAVIQHFPRTIARRTGVDFRLPTPQEKADMRAFMLAPEFESIPGTGNSKFNEGHFARTLAQRRGLAVFNTRGQCRFCHNNEVFASPAKFNTGVLNQAINKPGADDLPTEPVGGMLSTRAFSTPGLFNIKNNVPAFHDNSAATVEDAVRFYTGPEFAQAQPGLPVTMNEVDVQDVAAFIKALVARNYTVLDGTTDVTRNLTNVNLGSVQVGTVSSAKTLTISNTSTTPVPFASPACAVTGANAAAFTANCGALNGITILPGASVSITVTFAPTAAGAAAAILELNTEDPTGVDLVGTGVAVNANEVNETFSVDSAGAPTGFTLQRGGTFSVSGGQLRLATCTTCSGANGNVLTHGFELPESFTFTVDALANATTSSFNDFSVIFNFKDINNYYFASFNEKDTRSDGTDDPNTNGIFKVVNGTRTQIRDFSSTTAPGSTTATLQKIRIEKMRQTIRVFRGNTLMGVVTDTAFTGGKVGLGSSNDSARFDNLKVIGHHLSEDFRINTQTFTKFLGGTFTVTGGKFQLTAPGTSSSFPNANVSVHNTAVDGSFDLFVDGNAPSTSQTNDDFSIIFNFQNVTNYMYANFGERDEATANGIFKVVNSVRTKIGTFGATLTAPGSARRIRIVRTPTTIQVFRDGTQIGPTVTDSTHAGTPGKVGVGSRNNAATFDHVFVEKK